MCVFLYFTFGKLFGSGSHRQGSKEGRRATGRLGDTKGDTKGLGGIGPALRIGQGVFFRTVGDWLICFLSALQYLFLTDHFARRLVYDDRFQEAGRGRTESRLLGQQDRNRSQKR